MKLAAAAKPAVIALLGGSLLLFGLLAVVMIATRRVDWYGLNGARPAAA
jgi:inner membrane protein